MIMIHPDNYGHVCPYMGNRPHFAELTIYDLGALIALIDKKRSQVYILSHGYLGYSRTVFPRFYFDQI